MKLETFIETNYAKDQKDDDDDGLSMEIKAIREAEKLKVYKCSNCDQYGHRTFECSLIEKNSKTVKVVTKKNIAIDVNVQKKPPERPATANSQQQFDLISSNRSTYSSSSNTSSFNSNSFNLRKNRFTNNLDNISVDLQKNKSKLALKEKKETKEPVLTDKSSKDLIEKISKLEALSRKQIEEIATLEEKLEQLNNENLILKGSIAKKRNNFSYY